MITIKNKLAIQKMEHAGALLSEMFSVLPEIIKSGATTADLDEWIEHRLKAQGLVSEMKGYHGYRHVSCISMNDEVVHGVPSKTKILKSGDLVKVDVCASWQGYCADMARSYFVDKAADSRSERLVLVAQNALDAGIAMARPGNRLGDISAAIQTVVEAAGYGVVRDFAGHGIGKSMHEDPEVLNYGKPGKGPLLQAGMAFALEPMITMQSYKVEVLNDGWTVRTVDRSLAVHVEDTVIILPDGPKIITRI